MSESSPRVNAAHLPNFVGRTIRLPCRVLDRHAGGALVEACDGGQVKINMRDNEQLEGTFFEIIGHVVDESTIKFFLGLNLDAEKDMDMKLVNDVIELTFHPKFKKLFPA